MTTKEMMELLKAALEDGHDTWTFDGNRLIAYGSDFVEGLMFTEYEIDEDDDGKAAIFCKDVWEDGILKTGWAFKAQIGA